MDHPDEFLVLLAPVEHVCHILQQLQQVFDLIDPPEEGMAASFVNDFLEQGMDSRPLPVESKVAAFVSDVWVCKCICSDSFVNDFLE